MDCNKDAYKLKGFGPLYITNLDGQPERWKWIEDQLNYWAVEHYERISAFDGRDDDLCDIIHGGYPDMSSAFVGNVTSHLKAIRHWYETTDAPYGVFMEDDCDFCSVAYWPFSFSEFVDRLPYDWDAVQLSVINPRKLVTHLHPRYVDDFSTACFMINRRYAEKLIHFHIRGDKFKLDNGIRPKPVADELIYNAGKTYTIPLFLYKLELGSSIHPNHTERYHRSSREYLDHWWTTESHKMTVDQFFEYAPQDLG